MAVYVTKSMLQNMNRVKLSTNTFETKRESNVGDHWQKLFNDGNKTDLSQASLCRICGRDGYTPLSETYHGYSIFLLIRSVTNISVDINDALPKYICTSCLDTLKIAFNFKNTSEASDRKFKRILNPMGDPARHSYPYSKHDFHLILHDMKAKRMELEAKKERKRQMYERDLKKKMLKGKYKCSSCDMPFETKDLLNEHRRDHKCVRRACDICGQLVINMKQHRRAVHKQTHKCNICSKEFPILARLKNHMMVHSDVFNFFCDLCPYKCKHKYYLVMHMRTHTGEKPYRCLLCPATFVNPSNLNKHKLIHQEKQFKCSLCDKAFRTSGALREHYEAAHMNIKHTCQFCGRDFCYRSDLRKHEIRSHNRTKRDYIGGEPTYKQVERLQRQPQETDDKWRNEIIVTHHTHQHSQHTAIVLQPQSQPQPQPQLQPQPQPHVVQATYVDVDQMKGYDNTQPIYFTDVNGLLHHQPIHHHLVQHQTVEIELPELMKKDEVKLTYEQQGIGYF